MAKGDNAILPLYDDADHITCAVAAGQAVTSGRFVSPSGGFQSGPLLNPAAAATDGGNIQVATTGAGAKALGVAAYDAPNPADKVHVYTGRFVVPMTAGAAITAGQQVESNATGQPIPLATGVVNGIAVSTAANGATVYVRLS
jgi:predicted RecA/RadA family phage recombinase